MKTAEELYMNVYGGTLRKIIEDLITQIDALESQPRLNKDEKEDLSVLVELAKPAVSAYIECHSVILNDDLEQYLRYEDFGHFVRKHMKEWFREKKLGEIGI
jgi:hypothetical protein